MSDHPFTAEALAALGGPAWLAARRADAFAAFEAMPLPSEKEEVWRYTPIDELDLRAYRPADRVATPSAAATACVAAIRADAGPCAATVIVAGGTATVLDAAGLPPGAVVGGAGVGPAEHGLGRVLVGGDALARLNDAFVPDAVVVDVPAGVRLDAPVLVVHWCEGAAGPAPAPATFPRTVVQVGAGAQASVVEVVAGVAVVVPVAEFSVGDGGQLHHVSLQVLGTDAWCLARTEATVGADAHLRTFSVGLGARYDRLRTDATVTGPGGHSELRSAYLGTGDQVHDIRTLQDHDAPRTTSDLLCKGAVADRSRSVYTGLIRIRHGAVRSEAMQTNHNLVLNDSAHADSVPNLDIAENDVRCSHASTIGPVDEDQQYYLESRGVPPARAERLIVQGFFDDVVDRSPIAEVVGLLRREVWARLAATLDSGGSTR
jgi:Fe-S cluster assembly protein SufD